jgi:hypothetical protein
MLNWSNRKALVAASNGRGRIMFFPCTQRHSSLQTVPEAAKPRTTRFCFHPFFQASPCFETLCDMANGFVQRQKQPIGVRPTATPIDMTICDRTQMHSESRQQSLPRSFLRENSGAKTSNPTSMKGREPRQPHE